MFAHNGQVRRRSRERAGGKKTTFCTTNEAKYNSLPSCTSLKKKEERRKIAATVRATTTNAQDILTKTDSNTVQRFFSI